jgi:hypothetical protein
MASFTHLNDLVDHFIEMEHPYYIISEDKKSIFSMNNKVNDIDEAGEKLKRALEHKDHSKVYYIYCFKKLNQSGLAIPLKAGNHLLFSYQKAKPEYSFEQKQQYYGGLGSMIQQQNERIDRLQQLLEAKMLQEDEVEDDDQVKESMQSNIIGQLMGNPAIANILTNLLTNIFANTMSTPNLTHNNIPSNIKPTALAGDTAPSDQELRLATILETLFDKGVTIDHLEKLASYPKAKISMLLTML